MKHTHTLPPILLIGLLLTLSSLPTVQAATNCAAVTEIPQAQCDTLLALYNSTGGANWTNKTGWNVTNAPCSWEGISCSGGNVTYIISDKNNLKGSLPDLSALTGLEIFWLLSNNQLTGPIPDLSKLTNLQTLDLRDNQLTGTIPDLSKLTSLSYLGLEDNQLTGPIPDLSKLTGLQGLRLSNNQLTGPIPDLSKLTGLQVLQLSNNQLTGPIPDLSKLTGLQSLQLSNNQLTSPIPDLSRLTNLHDLLLNDNQLSGPIPGWNNLTQLTAFQLSNNPQLCLDTNTNYTNYRTQTEVNSFPICSTVPLTITKTGTGTGIVTSTSNATINCGTTCQANLALNGTVTLTATPATDSTFANWSEDCTGTTANITTVTMDVAKSCTATFNQIPQLTLAITKTGTGTGIVETNDTKINCGTTCQSSFSINSTFVLTATPASDSSFAGWSGACMDTTYNGKVRVTMDTAKSCIATFNKIQLSLTVTKTGTGAGEVKTADTKINCGNGGNGGNGGNVCQSYFSMNSTVTLIATPAINSIFMGWSGASCTGTTASLVVTMDADKSCLASFKQTQSLIYISKIGTGEVKTADTKINCGTVCQSYFSINSTVILTATPATDSTFTGWGGACTGITANTTVTMDTTNIKFCTAVFKKIPLPLTVSKNGTGTGAVKTTDTIITNTNINCGPTCQSDFSPNTRVPLIAISSTGSTFTGWTGDCTGTDTSITLTMNAAKTCTASFAIVPTSCPTTTTTNNNISSVVTLPSSSQDLISVPTLPEAPFCTQVTEIPKLECQTLIALYNDTAGSTWTNQNGWNNTTTPCQWYGIECTNGQVTALYLTNNNLQGTLPPLSALTMLKQLAVADNLLKGVLPDLPTSLEILTGDRNQLSGPLTMWHTLTQLRQVSLSDNQLSDALPDLSLLTRLEILNLNNNQLAGPIPDLRKLTQLKQLLLKDNHLAGAIPALTVTNTLDLSGNDQLCRDINLTYTQTALNAYPPCSYPTLTVAKTGSGIGLVSATSPTDEDKLNCGLECVKTDQTYSPDSNVTVTATPTEGTVFTGWSGECNGTTETTTVTLDQAKTCVANFEIQTGYYELQVSKTGIGKGTVTTPNKDDPFHCDAKCQETRGTYPANTQVKLRANASKGSEFTGWGGACSGTDQRLTLTMDQAKSCFANFNLKEPPPPAMRQLIINPDAGNGKGTVTTEGQGIDCGIDCLENYKDGKYVKLTATPLPGSSFLSWEDDCSGKDPTLTVKMTGNKLCTALFANDTEMTAAETVTDFYTNGYLDTGEEVQDRYPRYPDNDQRLQEAFLFAQPAILTVDLQVDLDNLEATWPLQFNNGMSFFRPQPAGVYTESVKILKDATVQGYLSSALVVGYYVEVRVKLLNYLGEEEWVPILTYWGEPPQESSAPLGGTKANKPCKPPCNGGGGGGKSGIGYRPGR